MRIAYVLYGEIRSPVVASQSFELLRRLRGRGHEVHFFVITSPRRHLKPSRWKVVLGMAREAAGGALTVLTHAPRHRRFGPVSRRLRRALTKFRPDVVHARQSRGGLVAGRADVAPVLLDLRGLRPEEFLLSLGREEEDLELPEWNALADLRLEDAEARRAASAVVCVSKPFREHLGGGDDVFVIPNAGVAVDASERAAIRERLGIGGDETAFVFSGTLSDWQCAEDTVRLFAAVRERTPGARLGLFSIHESRAEQLAREAGVDDAIVRRFTADETRRMLTAFDAGLLLRQASLVNRVAAPVKFAEYLHAGLPVVLTEGIGDASRQVREERLGIVLPSLDDETNAERVAAGLDPEAGERGRVFARANLTFDVTVPLYERAYEAARGASA